MKNLEQTQLQRLGYYMGIYNCLVYKGIIEDSPYYPERFISDYNISDKDMFMKCYENGCNAIGYPISAMLDEITKLKDSNLKLRKALKDKSK